MSYQQHFNSTTMIKVKQPEKQMATTSAGPIIILSLGIVIIILILIAVALYWQKRKKLKTVGYRKLTTSTRQKPNLTLSIPEIHKDRYSNESLNSENLDTPFKHYEFMIPPHTPITPNTPLGTALPVLDPNKKYSFQRSTSVPAENVFVSNDRDADGLWRAAVKKASASQFLSTKPKTENKIAHCANGKMKFSLKYNILGQKELTVKLLEFVDLPLSRETGLSVPFVKVYLYPQTAHLYPPTEKNKSGFRVEILSFPRESTCSFVGWPIDKLCSSALKFVILDYDRFSRSEFVADCVVLLDEVSLEGDQITQHLSIRKAFLEKDVGSLLVSLCYQPNGSRMCIIVLKASGLPEGESGHFPDHFVKISLLKNGIVLDKRRTRVIKKSVCPVFNERLVFPVDVHGTRSLVFVFDVIRYDSKLKQEKVASVVLGNHYSHRQVTPHEIQHFNEMLRSPQRQIAEWHKLVP